MNRQVEALTRVYPSMKEYVRIERQKAIIEDIMLYHDEPDGMIALYMFDAGMEAFCDAIADTGMDEVMNQLIEVIVGGAFE